MIRERELHSETAFNSALSANPREFVTTSDDFGTKLDLSDPLGRDPDPQLTWSTIVGYKDYIRLAHMRNKQDEIECSLLRLERKRRVFRVALNTQALTPV